MSDVGKTDVQAEILIKLTGEQLAAVDAAAKRDGMSRNRWIRWTIALVWMLWKARPVPDDWPPRTTKRSAVPKKTVHVIIRREDRQALRLLAGNLKFENESAMYRAMLLMRLDRQWRVEWYRRMDVDEHLVAFFERRVARRVAREDADRRMRRMWPRPEESPE
jgi:hypothetical protein